MNHTTTIDCHQLAHRLAAGDPIALREVDRAHRAAMLSAARSVLRDGDLAFDVVQDVLADVWANPQKYDPSRGRLRPYLITRTRSRALDILRSETSRRRREAADAAGLGREQESIEEQVTARSQAADLHSFLNNLPRGQRQAVALAYLGGYSYRDVAIRLSIPEGTAKSRIRAGLSRLRSDYADLAA